MGEEGPGLESSQLDPPGPHQVDGEVGGGGHGQQGGEGGREGGGEGPAQGGGEGEVLAQGGEEGAHVRVLCQGVGQGGQGGLHLEYRGMEPCSLSETCSSRLLLLQWT